MVEWERLPSGNMRNSVILSRWKLAHFAPAFFLLLSLAACASTAPVEGQGMSVSGYMTKANLKGKYLRYSISSLLAGPPGEISCRPGSLQAKGVSLVDCAGVPSDESRHIARQFKAASDSYLNLAHGLGISKTNVILIPMGVGYADVAKFIERPGELSVKLAVRYRPGNDALLRNGVRAYAHELVHLNRKASGWRVSRDREEYLASLMESCVELDVFGDSKGYVLEGDIAIAEIKGLSRSQKRSADMFSAAYLDIRSFMTGTEPIRRGQGRFEEFCRATFNSVGT